MHCIITDCASVHDIVLLVPPTMTMMVGIEYGTHP